MSEIGEGSQLTHAQRARIDRNRQKALVLRQAKLVTCPYAKKDANNPEKSVIKIQGTKYIDTGGGFLIEEQVGPKEEEEIDVPIEYDGGPVPVILDECKECSEKFHESFLLKNFDLSVCDKCRDRDDKHSLITRTEAKERFLLKDCDFDKREPQLKFITSKNPHNIRWGEMKLYLLMQIEQRALDVWGSEENLEKQRESRVEKREVSKIKKYNKQLKQLRMEVRSSMYDKTSAVGHIHSFGEETYDEEDDNYTRTCETCPYIETYEKM